MEETFNLMSDMTNLECIVSGIEADLCRADLTNEERAELQARQLYLHEHLRLALMYTRENLGRSMRISESRVTDGTKERLKAMTFDRATDHAVSLYSRTMTRINGMINNTKLSERY